MLKILLPLYILSQTVIFADAKADLFEAAKSGDVDNLKAALKAGANVNATLTESWGGMFSRTMTALMLASEQGQTEIVKLLIRARANVRVRTWERGSDALGFAVKKGHLEIVGLILAAKPDLNARQGQVPGDDRDPTALMLATWNGHLEIAKLLIAKGANVNAQDPSGYTALMFVDNPEIVRLLLAKKAKVNAKSKGGETALTIATGFKLPEIIKLLKDAGAAE